MLVLLSLALMFCVNVSAKPGEKITNLPGYSGPALDMESGYQSAGGLRKMFYWLVRAEDKNPNAPLVFWYTGGPGCSSLSALFSETGPLRINAAGDVEYTNLGWSRHANMVFSENPIGVGFSYSDDPLDYVTGDDKSSKANYAFVQNFLESYPEFKGRDTYLTGESYGGEYVPHLTLHILSDPSTQIYKQYSGFMIGNPVMGGSSRSDGGQFTSFYESGLVSGVLKAAWDAAGCHPASNGGECGSILDKATDQVGVIDQELRRRRLSRQPSLDPDDLYQDFTTGNGTLSYPAQVPGTGTPSGDRITKYLNRADVHKAIHASGILGHVASWSVCTNRVAYTGSNTDQIPRYAQFPSLKPGVKLMVYDGDVDIATVPHTFTAPAVYRLTKNSTELKPWGPWFVGGQSVGYSEIYDVGHNSSFIYAHVRGSGHEAPQYQPYSSFHMFQRFIFNGNLEGSDEDRRSTLQSGPTRAGQKLREALRRNGLRLH